MMLSRKALTAITAAVLISRLTSHVSPLAAQDFTTRADSILHAFVGADAPGCAVAIDSAGSVAYRGAFGLAELEHQIPITVGTIFEAGSVSKQFTAAAVLLLEARGELSLDDPVQQWFPEIPRYQWPVTIRHLMLHTSGMRDWGAVMGLAGWPRWTAAYTHADALAIIARQRDLNHEPGAAFSYTNTGYNLMAMLVERVAGESFAAFTHREFFQPLGMTHTTWRDDYTRIVPGRAQAYQRRDGAWHLDMPIEHVFGNGGLLTTVEDLLRWTAALATGRLGSPDVSTAMRTSGRYTDGRPVNYGGGIFLTPIRGVTSFNHGGATAGYRAFLGYFPEQQVSAAILCNRADANTAALNITLLGGVLPFGRTPPPTAPEAVSRQPLEPTQLAAYTGTWWSDEVAASLRIFTREARLYVERRPGQVDELFAVGTADRFTTRGNLGLRFERDSSGSVTRLVVSVSRVNAMPYSRK